jgi:hypothetical protein
MPGTWYDHFKFSMDSVGLPAPSTLYDTCARATATLGALIAALKSVGSEAGKAMTLRQLLTAARGGASLSETLGAASTGELIAAAGGCVAAFYVGAVVGACIYATTESASDWVDDVFSHDQATTNVQQMQATAARFGARTPQGPPPPPPAFGGQSSDMCTVPVNSCTDGALSDVNYCKGWPSKPWCQ